MQLHLYGGEKLVLTVDDAVQYIKVNGTDNIFGISDEKVAYFAGLKKFNKDTTKAEELLTRNITLFEYYYEKGELEVDKLDQATKDKLKQKLPDVKVKK